jgi:hypothetical protein
MAIRSRRRRRELEVKHNMVSALKQKLGKLKINERLTRTNTWENKMKDMRKFNKT